MSTRLRDVVPDAYQFMGVKAVFGALSSHALCFGPRGAEGEVRRYSVAAGAARKASERPFVVTIGGGANVRDQL